MKQLFATVLVVGLLVAYWPWVVGIMMVAIIVRAIQTAQVRADEKRVADAAIVARADKQHAWAMAGDPRGTFGEWEPALVIGGLI